MNIPIGHRDHRHALRRGHDKIAGETAGCPPMLHQSHAPIFAHNQAISVGSPVILTMNRRVRSRKPLDQFSRQSRLAVYLSAVHKGNGEASQIITVGKKKTSWPSLRVVFHW